MVTEFAQIGVWDESSVFSGDRDSVCSPKLFLSWWSQGADLGHGLSERYPTSLDFEASKLWR